MKKIELTAQDQMNKPKMVHVIESVPEIIDALIEIIHVYESAPDTSTLDTRLDPAIQKAREALKKAGRLLDGQKWNQMPVIL